MNYRIKRWIPFASALAFPIVVLFLTPMGPILVPIIVFAVLLFCLIPPRVTNPFTEMIEDKKKAPERMKQMRGYKGSPTYQEMLKKNGGKAPGTK